MTKSVTTTTATGRAEAGSQVLLDINALGISFGGLKAVQDFSLQLPVAGLFGLIGPNGAGKTTIFNLLTGVYARTTVRFIWHRRGCSNASHIKSQQQGSPALFKTFACSRT
ncbi:MAG: ATP-binding cassette domain-containing protein [Planctomycetaceae bacterium]